MILTFLFFMHLLLHMQGSVYRRRIKQFFEHLLIFSFSDIIEFQPPIYSALFGVCMNTYLPHEHWLKIPRKLATKSKVFGA